MKHLLCRWGLHRWVTIYDDYPRLVQQCLRCGEKRSTMYDMLYGTTYWVTGDWWAEADARVKQATEGEK